MPGLIDNAQIAEAKVFIDKTFNDALLQEADEFVDDLVLRTTSSAFANKYIMSAGLTRLREWLGERIYENFRRSVMLVENRKFEKSVEVAVDDIEDDQLDGYAFLIQEIARQCGLWPQDLVVDAIIKGETAKCFDGQSFFNLNHPADFGNPSSAVYPNLFTALPLVVGGTPQYGNVATVLGKMRVIPGRDGRPLGFGRSGKLALVVPPQLEIPAKQVVNNSLIQGGDSNPLQGIAKVIVAPDLGASGQADAATSWYIADIGSKIKPFIFQMRKDPKSTLTAMTAPNDPNVFEKDVMRWGVKARGAAAYGMPSQMAKVKAT